MRLAEAVHQLLRTSFPSWQRRQEVSEQTSQLLVVARARASLRHKA